MPAKEAREAIRNAPRGEVYLFYTFLDVLRHTPITKAQALRLMHDRKPNDTVPITEQDGGRVLIHVDAAPW